MNPHDHAHTRKRGFLAQVSEHPQFVLCTFENKNPFLCPLDDFTSVGLHENQVRQTAFLNEHICTSEGEGERSATLYLGEQFPTPPGRLFPGNAGVQEMLGRGAAQSVITLPKTAALVIADDGEHVMLQAMNRKRYLCPHTLLGEQENKRALLGCGVFFKVTNGHPAIPPECPQVNVLPNGTPQYSSLAQPQTQAGR